MANGQQTVSAVSGDLHLVDHLGCVRWGNDQPQQKPRLDDRAIDSRGNPRVDCLCRIADPNERFSYPFPSRRSVEMVGRFAMFDDIQTDLFCLFVDGKSNCLVNDQSENNSADECINARDQKSF